MFLVACVDSRLVTRALDARVYPLGRRDGVVAPARRGAETTG